MMTLQGDAPIEEIDAYLAAHAATVLGSERLAPTEVATIVQARSLDEAVDLIRGWLRIHRIGQRVPFSAIEVRRLA